MASRLVGVTACVLLGLQSGAALVVALSGRQLMFVLPSFVSMVVFFIAGLDLAEQKDVR